MAETIGAHYSEPRRPCTRDAILRRFGLVLDRWSHPLKADASQVPTSLQIARSLLARQAAPGGKGSPAMSGAALQRTVKGVSESLRDSMGEDGRNALLVRALARTEADHPALKNVVGLKKDGIQLDGVIASVEAHGVAAVTTAIEALVAALIDLLARLIGEDMAIRLIDPDAARSLRGDGAKAS